jgi:hypothetical protein
MLDRNEERRAGMSFYLGTEILDDIVGGKLVFVVIEEQVTVEVEGCLWMDIPATLKHNIARGAYFPTHYAAKAYIEATESGKANWADKQARGKPKGA